MFRLSWTTHAAQMAAILASMALLRFSVVQNAAQSILGQLLPASTSATKKYEGGDYFESLSSICWFSHLLTMVWNLEIVAILFKDDKTLDDDNNKRRRASRTFWFLGCLFAMSHVQAWLNLLSHSLIQVNGALEISLLKADYILMQTHVFGTGLVLLLGMSGCPSHIAAAGALFIAGLVFLDLLQFANPAGICCSTLSMAVLVTRPELPVLFRASWILLAAMPGIFPDSSNDGGHTVGGFILNVPLALMAYALNRHHDHFGTSRR